MNQAAVQESPLAAADSQRGGTGDSPRYHHLDAARAFALLLGVFFHAAESFGHDNTYWAIVDCSSTTMLEGFRFACHSFRLELFFVIAGFFARLLLLRRGTPGFMMNRVRRILVPLVVGWLLLYPLLAGIWLWGASVSGHMGQLGIPAEFQSLPIWKLTLGFFMSGMFVEKFDLTHLWFLHQLLVVYVFILGLRWFIGRVDARGSIMSRCDTWFGRVNSSRVTVLWLALPTIPIMFTMKSWGVDTPKESLVPHLPTTLLFVFCFLMGWLWHRQPDLLGSIAPRWRWHLALGVVCWLAFGWLDDPNLYRGATRTQLFWLRLIFETLYAQMMWGFVLGFLGLFTRFCMGANAWSRYIADSSYWIYIAHLPLIVGLQVLFGRVAMAWPLKYSLICLIALPLLFVSYHYLVRGTFIGVQLNGRRYPLRWPWQSEQ